MATVVLIYVNEKTMQSHLWLQLPLGQLLCTLCGRLSIRQWQAPNVILRLLILVANVLLTHPRPRCAFICDAKHHVFVKKGCWNADLPPAMPLKQCYRAIANNRSSRFLWCSIIIYTLCFRLQSSSWRLTCLTLPVSKARVPDFDTTSCPIW